MSSRRKISQSVQARLSRGETKADIYNELKTEFPAGAVERSLAQWPAAGAKKKTLSLNIPLIIIAVFFALLRILMIAPVLSELAPAQVAAAGLLIIIHLYTIYGVINYNLVGYMLIILMSLNNILNVLQAGLSDPKLGMILAMSAAAIMLAVIQKRKLFPNTSWLMRHKRDSSGNPIF